ncbi:hypothetical protein ABIA27_006383 [Sinorhizobium fredii]
MGEVAGGGGRDDDADARLQVGALFAQCRFLGIELAHRKPVLLEDFDRRRHVADLVLASGKGHVDGEFAAGQQLHPASQIDDRPAEMVGADIEGRADTGSHAEAGNAEDDEDDRAFESGDAIRDGLEGLAVGIDDHVDLRLEGLSVGAIGLIVALLVGGLRRDLAAEPGGFRAERLEFLGAFGHRVEGRQPVGRYQWTPLLQQRVDLAEVLDDALGEGGRLFDRRRGVDPARFHHDGRDQTIEALALEASFGGVLELAELVVVLGYDQQRHAGDGDRQQAHDANDQVDLSANSHFLLPPGPLALSGQKRMAYTYY